MFSLSTTDTYQLYIKPTDMRKSFDGLSGLIETELEMSPTNGQVYIFINKRRDKIKLLFWTGSGFMQYYKRLESGTYEMPKYDSSVRSLQLSYSQLVLLIDGISITNIVRRKRYKSTIQSG